MLSSMSYSTDVHRFGWLVPLDILNSDGRWRENINEEKELHNGDSCPSEF